MTVIEYGEIILNEYPNKRLESISLLQIGLNSNKEWNETHKEQVEILITWLKSGSEDINDLKSKFKENIVQI